MGPQLDTVNKLICERLESEVDRRVLAVYRTREDFGWMGLKNSNPVNNWNPWINSDVLTCALLLDKDAARRAQLTHKILTSLDRFLDSTSAIRFHFGEVLLSAGFRALAVLLLGFPFVSIVLFESLLLCATIFHHSNLRLPAHFERALSAVVITPGIHWVHHHAARADTDANYGTLFSFWDRIFRTRSPTRRTPAMAIGVEGEGDRALPALLARPFRRRR
jgi:hypothetical protein